MIKLGFLFLLSSWGTSAAVLTPHSQAEFCTLAQKLENFQDLADEPETRIAFSNTGGLLNKGVCWWHSRFQRSALYLSVFLPKGSRPTSVEAKKIISDIYENRRVVEISGYNNLSEFSSDWSELLLAQLEFGQKVDGFIKQAWINGLSGSTSTEADNFYQMSAYLYDEVETKKRITYQKLAMPGIVSHAWLVTKMIKQDQKYLLNIIDSNDPLSATLYTVQPEQKNFEYALNKKQQFVAYTERQDDFKAMQVEIFRYCHPAAAMQRWLPQLEAKAQMLSKIKSQQNAQYTLLGAIGEARTQGKFSTLMREKTLSDDELLPSAWTQLMNQKD